jgi:hypothetical protein
MRVGEEGHSEKRRLRILMQFSFYTNWNRNNLDE